jgi:hypothetical protein
MRKLLLGAVFLISLLAVVLVLVGFARPLASSLSPNKHYLVQIEQRSVFPVMERYVYLNAFRDGQSFLKRRLLFTGDLLDNDFRDLYPNYSWLSESTLKIGQPDNDGPDTLHIINGSQRVKYLLVETYVDKFVMFDLEPGRSIDLPFRYFGRLSCQGEFYESHTRFGDAVEFESPNADSSHLPTTFSVTVTADGVKLGSQLPLKHDTCCAVDRSDINHE